LRCFRFRCPNPLMLLAMQLLINIEVSEALFCSVPIYLATATSAQTGSRIQL